MQNSWTSYIPQSQDSRGAATLKDGLVRGFWYEWHETFSEHIDLWQDAIKGKHAHKSLSEGEQKSAEAIHAWYWKESQSRSYQAPSWKITPERALLFQQFRSDPNYHLKNLVEIVGRHLVEEMLRSEGIQARVSLTSDSDDVFSGVDLIIEVKNTEGKKEYTGIDIAISENQQYLSKKESRTETVCREFNAFKWHGNLAMPRQVFAIPPRVMSRFLENYMERIGTHGAVSSTEILALFHEANTKTVATVREKIQSKVQSITH